MDSLVFKPGYSCLIGDFNIYIKSKNNSHIMKFTNLRKEYGYCQKVPYVTKTHIRVYSGTLDLIIISEDMPVNNNKIRIFDQSIPTNHFQICFDINGVHYLKIEESNTFYRNYKILNLENFKQDLLSSYLLKID